MASGTPTEWGSQASDDAIQEMCRVLGLGTPTEWGSQASDDAIQEMGRVLETSGLVSEPLPELQRNLSLGQLNNQRCSYEIVFRL